MVKISVTISIDSPIEVEEGELLSFHFNNYTNHGHFVYILCLEETGKVLVWMQFH